MTAEKPTELSYNPHLPLSQALLLPRIVIEDTSCRPSMAASLR
jgi:starch synthase (maltosyl-transferring)